MTNADKPFNREQLAQQYIPDFLEESDEHLRKSALNLLALEKAMLDPEDQSKKIVELIHELFRAFHTLKGLSGIVGLVPAVELSHTIESILDSLRAKSIQLNPGVIDSLVRGTQTLEKVIVDLTKENAPLPDLTQLLAELAAHLPEEIDPTETSQMSQSEDISEPSDEFASVHPLTGLPEALAVRLDEDDWQQISKAARTGKKFAVAIFTPSEEKAVAGISVNSVRNILTSAAELLKAVPLLTDEQVQFGFLLFSNEALKTETLPELDWHFPKVIMPEKDDSAAKNSGNVDQIRISSAVRVDIQRLDELMRHVGDLIVSRSRLADVLPQLRGAPQNSLEILDQTTSVIERQLRALRESVMRIRMVPLNEAFSRLPLAVRDLARESDRRVRLEIEGEETEIDKMLVEQLHEPLLHLARNAITHGIETPAERTRIGKPPEGVLTLCGRPEGDHILISISDDGAGIDLDKIEDRARSLGLINSIVGSISEEEALHLICRPGFTTKKGADLGSGRGVGMDVVRRMVDGVGGTLSMRSTLAQGTSFQLRLPLTITIIDALIIQMGSERYAVSRGDVHEVIEIQPAEIVHAQHGQIIPYRDAALPLIHLRPLFGLQSPTNGHTLYGLVSGNNGSRFALVVDRVLSLREIVVHPLSDALVAQPGITGATDLGDGQAVLILELPGLRRLARAIVS